MSVGQNGGLIRHDMTTRCLLGRAAGSVSPTDAYHARPPNEVVCFMAEQTTVYRLAVRHRSVSRHQTFTVHCVNTLFDLADVASAAASPVARCLFFPRSVYCSRRHNRDGVAAAGRGGYLTAKVKVVYFCPAGSNFDYRLLTG